jgi:hypothetical protein
VENKFTIRNLSINKSGWVLIVLLVNKSAVNKFSNGTWIRFQFADKHSCIELVAYRQDCERFLNLELNNVYEVTGCNVKKAMSNCTLWSKDDTLRSPYELIARSDTSILIIPDANPLDYAIDRSNSDYSVVNSPPETPENSKRTRPHSIGRFKNHIKINQIPSLLVGTLCNVVGIIDSIEKIGFLFRREKTNISLQKFIIFDESYVSISVALWGKQAETFSLSRGTVIDFKLVKICKFGEGKLSLSVIKTSYYNDITDSSDEMVQNLLRLYNDSTGSRRVFNNELSK